MADNIPFNIDVARALRSSGWSTQRISDYFSVSRSHVSNKVGDVTIDARALRAQQNTQDFDARYREAILAAADENLSMQGIAERIGLPQHKVRSALHRYLSADELAERRRRVLRHKHQRSGHPRYGREELVSLLREAAGDSEMLSVQRYMAWREQSGRGPTPAIFTKYLGSWREAVAAAGLRCGETHERFGCPHYSDEQVSEALRRIALKLGHAPTLAEYDSHRLPEEPVAATVRVRYGSWSDALRENDLFDVAPLAA